MLPRDLRLYTCFIKLTVLEYSSSSGMTAAAEAAPYEPLEWLYYTRRFLKFLLLLSDYDYTKMHSESPMALLIPYNAS